MCHSIGVDNLEKLANTDSRFAMLTLNLANPFGLGRIVRDNKPSNRHCRRKMPTMSKDKSLKSIAVCTVSPMIFCIDISKTWTNNNAQGEYYLTDIVKMAVDDGIEIATVSPTHQFEIEGVNDRLQLANLERTWQTHQAEALMKQGVHLIDPKPVLIYAVRSKLAKDVQIGY